MQNDFDDNMEEESAPFWMISFGDMMAILLTFFVMLYSFSTMNTNKAQAVSTSLSEQFGPMAGARLFLSTEGKDGHNHPTPEVLPSKSLPIRMPPQKNINGIITFDHDSHELSDSAKKEIQEIIPLLSAHDRSIEIRGHAGKNERGSFRDAMDLGYARTYNVRSYLIELGISPSRIQVFSLGEYHPVEGEESLINSCVEIYILASPVSE